MPGPARYSQSRAKLADCELHGGGTGSELILVEGDSAQDSVLAVRDARTQAVLPLQGKPLNAWAASPEKVAQHVLFQQLAQALGLAGPIALPEAGLAALRFERIVLLFDPDADGIHIGALVQLYFARWLPPVVEAGMLCLCRAPMYELVDADGVVHHALTPDHRQRIEQSLRRDEQTPLPMVRALRGIGGFAPDTLRRLCVDPATRLARVLTPRDVQDAVHLFANGV
jgi:DNA gyrase subunit B